MSCKRRHAGRIDCDAILDATGTACLAVLERT